ncbi:hypothetical protein K458DRAFT_408747 [Lentithecium fluviatile CBS 122367]|uniref:Rhodopsin domain-containing protein n=1 Tax=Lentithecium fluviatile CBS 122367 TaxID=1168545 RepID=A0A6G1IKD4_9PLEO|nr:hypothetical protein K458DRAFT_408747 [Lentithecium fluviatile CBS 122367]
MASVYYETGKHLIAASIALVVVDIIAVATKFWVRLSLKQTLMADDWLLVPATILSIGIASMLTYGAHEGALGGSIKIPTGADGRAELEMAQMILGRKIQYPFLFLHPLAVGSVRCSFLFLYLRIFSVNKARKLIMVSIYIVAAWAVSFFFAELFQCGTHFTSNWGSNKVFAAHCPDTLWILFVNFLTSAILDVYILLLPMPFVWKLKLNTTKKIGVTSIFLVGSATVVASVLRLAFLAPRVFSTKQGPPLTFEQRSASLSSTLYWGMVELGVAIFVACLPTVQKLFRPQDGKGLLSRLGATGASSKSKSNTSSSSRTLGSKITNKPRIFVDHTVDIAYEDTDTDSRPILSGLENLWTRRGKKSEDNVSDIEMQSGRSRSSDPVEPRTYTSSEIIKAMRIDSACVQPTSITEFPHSTAVLESLLPNNVDARSSHMNTTATAARSTSILDAMSDVSELQDFGTLPMCIALDKSGSTFGKTLTAELDVAKKLCHLRQDSSAVPVKVLPWCDKAFPPIEFPDSSDAKRGFGSGGGTDPSSLYSSTSCLAALRSAGLWVLMTDGKIYDSLVEKFAVQTADVGVHNKPCVIVVFGDISHGRPAACNISVGIAIYAVVPDCLFLFHDIPTGIVRVMQAKGKFKELLPLNSDGQRVKLEVSAYTVWAELPRIAYKDLFNVELSVVRNLDPDEMAFQDGLIVNIPDMLAGKVDESTIEKIVHNSDNLRSIAVASKTKGTGKHIAAWLKAQQKSLPPKVSLPEDVGKRANIAINNLLEALRTGEPDWKLGNLRSAVRDAHARNMIDFWLAKGRGYESESEIRRRNLRLRNAAKAASASRVDMMSAAASSSVSQEALVENNAPSTLDQDSAVISPIPIEDLGYHVPPTSEGHVASFLPTMGVENFKSSTFTFTPFLEPSVELPLAFPASPSAEISPPSPVENSKFNIASCGYASGASDDMERTLRVTRDRPEEKKLVDFDATHLSFSSPYSDYVSGRKRDADDGRTGIASRIVRRKRAQRSRSSSVCRDKQDPILVPSFQRHDTGNELRGRCMLCHNDDAVLTLLLKKPPPVSTEGFPREGSNTKIAFPLAMGSFAEMKAVSSFVSCDACAFHLLRIGTCPTSEIIVAALCLVSLPKNRAAVLEAIDQAIRGRFDKGDLMATSIAMLEAKLIDDEKNQDIPAPEKELFRKCVEWVLLNLVDILEVPASLSPFFADPNSGTLPTLTLNKLLGADEFRDPSRVENTELLLLRYPIPGFLVLLRLLCLMDLASPEEAHTLVFHKVMFLVMEHYIARRASSMPQPPMKEILGGDGRNAKTSFSLAELDEHSLLEPGSLQSLESAPDFDTFNNRSGPALAVFLHHFLHGGTGYSTAASCFNALKLKPASRNLFFAPLGISSGLAVDMISNV